MKNYFFLGLFALVTIFACSELNNQTELKEIESFYYLGDVHNEYMEHAALNFDNSLDLTAKEGVNYTKGFMRDFTSSNVELSQELVIYFDKPEFGRNFLDHDIFKSEVSNCLPIYQRSLQDGFIDQWEFDFITELVSLSHTTTFPELQVYIDTKIIDWEAQGYMKNSTDGDVSGMILALSKKSTDWWIDNQEYQTDLKLAPWVVGDAFGAAVGMAVHMGGYYSENGSMDGCCGNGIGVSMLAGAAMVSLGVGSRVMSGFSKWFRS